MQYLVTLFFMAISFIGANVALAQTDAQLADLAKPVLDAVMGGNYLYGAALALVLLVALVRRFGGAVWPLLASKKAAPFLVMVGAFGAAMATSLGAGEGVTVAMAWAAVKVAVLAAGGYSLLKPVLQALQKRSPMWADPLFAVAGWIFETRSKAAEAKIAKAIDAGVKAVADKQAQGVDIDFQDVE